MAREVKLEGVVLGRGARGLPNLSLGEKKGWCGGRGKRVGITLFVFKQCLFGVVR